MSLVAVRRRAPIVAALPMGVIALALLVGALAAGGCAFPGDSLEDLEGIAGTYVVNGVDPLGVEYSGTVVITPDDTAADGTYAVEWLVTGTVQKGVGHLAGNRFVVEWSTVEGAGPTSSSGSATYTVAADGVLRGTRTVDGIDEPGTEEIFPEP